MWREPFPIPGVIVGVAIGAEHAPFELIWKSVTFDLESIAVRPLYWFLVSLAPERDGKAIIRVYEFLASGVGPSDPILFRHPITTGGQSREVGLLYATAGESDGDLLGLLAARGADPNPKPRCNDNRDSQLAAARRFRDSRVAEILLAKGALDDY